MGPKERPLPRSGACTKSPTPACARPHQVLLTLQNPDGGWATYENNRGYGWYEWLNPSEVFGDIMIDYSYVECSMASLSALYAFRAAYPRHRRAEVDRAIRRGRSFIKSIQRPDGSWYGSWTNPNPPPSNPHPHEPYPYPAREP